MSATNRWLITQNEWYVVSEHGPEKHPGPFSFREAHQTASFPVPEAVWLYLRTTKSMVQVRGKFWSRRLRIRQVGLNSGGYVPYIYIVGYSVLLVCIRFDDLYLSAFEVYGKVRPLTDSEMYAF